MYSLIIVLFIGASLYAQSDVISYQAVILNPQSQELPGVNAESNIFPNKAIAMRFTIMDSNNAEIYQETQETTTDAYGLVNLFIGEGNQTSTQSFIEIYWDGTSKKLKVEIDFKDGNSFIDLGTQKLTFTPYAYHRDVIASGNLTVDGETIFKGDLNIDGTTTLNDDLTVNANASITGSIHVAEEASFESDLSVEGVTTLNDDLIVNADTLLEGSINVTEEASFESDLTVEGTTTLNDDLTVTGQTIFESDLNVEGNTVIANLVVKGGNDIGGGAGANHIALFENTNPSNGNTADGIAIRIQGNASNKLGFRNRFVTFYGNGDYVAGRIESYDLLGGDLWESFPTPDFGNLINIFDFSNVLVGGSLPSLAFHGGSLPTASFGRGSLPSLDIDFPAFSFDFNRGSLPSLSFYRGALPTTSFSTGSFPTLDFDGFWNPTPATGAAADLGAMVSWGMRNGNPGYMPETPWGLALVPLVLAVKQVARDQGVIYGSKGADYAEWLEKEDLTDSFMFGEVVGVKGGKISRNTTDADQVMSISLAPIVLGNMPDEDRKQDFEKVGFMGQVPVLTLGIVEVGDYIIASGYNDGYAKAISSKNLKLKDLKGIIGRAWTSSEGKKASIINVSVGLKTNEWVSIFEQHEERLKSIEIKLEKLQNLLNKIEKITPHLSTTNL